MGTMCDIITGCGLLVVMQSMHLIIAAHKLVYNVDNREQTGDDDQSWLYCCFVNFDIVIISPCV